MYIILIYKILYININHIKCRISLYAEMQFDTLTLTPKGGKRGGKVLISGDITLNGVGYSLQGSDHAVGGNCK